MPKATDSVTKTKRNSTPDSLSAADKKKAKKSATPKTPGSAPGALQQKGLNKSPAADVQPQASRTPPNRPTKPTEAGKRTINAADSLVDLSTDDLPMEGTISLEQYGSERSHTKKKRLAGVAKAREEAAAEEAANDATAAASVPDKAKKKKAKVKKNKPSLPSGGAATEVTASELEAEPEAAEAELEEESCPDNSAPPTEREARKASHPTQAQQAPQSHGPHAHACDTRLHTQHGTRTSIVQICILKMESDGFCPTLHGGGSPAPNGSTVGAPYKCVLLDATNILGQILLEVVVSTTGTGSESQKSGSQGHAQRAATQSSLSEQTGAMPPNNLAAF